MEVKFIAEAFLLINPIFAIRDYWNNGWTEGDVLSLAAGVESNTNHPLGKAIMEAAQAANCINMKVLTAEVHHESEINLIVPIASTD